MVPVASLGHKILVWRLVCSKRLVRTNRGIGDWCQPVQISSLRCCFPGALLATCAGNFGFISVMKLIYVWDDIWSNFAIWRLLTPFLFVGKFDFNTLMCLYMLQSFSQRYETEPYNTGAGGGTADYVAMIMVRHLEFDLGRSANGNLVTHSALFSSLEWWQSLRRSL